MNSLLRALLLFPAIALPAAAANIAPLGTGLMGSNDATITDTGSSHFATGTLANIRDGNLTTRVDNYQTNQPNNVNGYVGVSWAAARAEAISSLTLTMAHFVDGGWFGNRESPKSGFPLTPIMLTPPVVQVSTNLTTWTTVPSTNNYLSAYNGQFIASNNTPMSRAFTISLPLKQTGVRGIRIIGPTGGRGDGNGFLGVFELEVEATAFTDSEPDGMDDAWETANGLAVGTNDAGLDADADGLSNEKEFRWNTNAQVTDSDGDGLSDGAEDATHGTFPNAADTDGDGFSDGAEVNTHLTNPALADSDADGLTDSAEINIHFTLPMNRDSDSDGFGDGTEIALGTHPFNAASRSANIARAGLAIMGRNNSTSAGDLAVTGTMRNNANTTASLNDGDLYTRADTSGMTGTASHAGVVWPDVWPQPVARVEITMALFADGGWFGNASNTPAAGSPLQTATHLTPAPVLQTTTDGTTWTTVPSGEYTTNYAARLNFQMPGGGAYPDATRRSAVFTLNTPLSGLRGVRVAGGHRNYVGVWEFAVCDSSTSADTDGDGLSDADEATEGTSAIISDTDGDTAEDGAEKFTLLTHPLISDTDADRFPDGLEVKYGTDPLSAASNPQNLSLLAGGIIGINNAADADNGTAVTNAGTPGNVTDGEMLTRVDTWNGTNANRYSYIGARWPSPVTVTVQMLQVKLATFSAGGWFGPANSTPGAGGALTAAHLIPPVIQVTTDGGTTWTTMPGGNNYVTALTGHVIAGADDRPTVSPVATFTLDTPATGINGVRLIGEEGGGSQPFVGVWDLAIYPTGEVLPPPPITARGLFSGSLRNGGELSHVIDGNPATVVHNYGEGVSDDLYALDTFRFASAGMAWSAPIKDSIKTVTVTMATFVEGGWFGSREAPPPGGALTREMLLPKFGTPREPILEVTTSPGAVAGWRPVAATSNYVERLTGHVIPATSAAFTTRSFTFTLRERPMDITGVRVVGPMSGSMSPEGFIGIADFTVETDPVTDADNDRMDDAWEQANGLTVGVDDAPADPDNDEFDNRDEYVWRSNPQSSDSDGDGLGDWEDRHRNGSPAVVDTDGDGLSDGAEFNTHDSWPDRTDSDGDGLNDGAEINTWSTGILDADSDNDGWSDGREVELGLNPLSAASLRPDFARAGWGIMGRTFSMFNGLNETTGVRRSNAGQSAWLNDQSLTTLAHTSNMTGHTSYAGIEWPARLEPGVVVQRLEITFATFGHGGWFSSGTGTPTPGMTLTAADVTATTSTTPTVQYTNDGLTWGSVPTTSDYVSRMTGHVIGSSGSIATRRSAIFTPVTPLERIKGIRVIGNHQNFLAVWNIAAVTNLTAGDTDGDGLSDAAETTLGTSIQYSDTDEDGLTDAAEVNIHNTNPLLADHDGDSVSDGEEIHFGSDPLVNAPVPAAPLQPVPAPNLASCGTAILGVKTALDEFDGTPVAHAGITPDINDEYIFSRVDSWNASGPGTYSYAGILWTAPQTVSRLTVRFATFTNGGWFGPTNTGPATSGYLTAAHLAEPAIQIRTQGSTSWITVPHTSDYIAVLTGHRVGDGTANNPAPMSRMATFTLNTTAQNVAGIRLIGLEGGIAEGFLGIYDLSVYSGVPVINADPDTDNDGLPDAWELAYFDFITDHDADDDPDHDGSNLLLEYGFDMNPKAFDTPPAAVLEGAYLTLTLTKRPLVTYSIHSGGTFLDFSAADTTTLIDNATTLKVRDNFLITGPASRRFLRALVTASP